MHFFLLFLLISFFFLELVIHSLWTFSVHKELHIHKPNPIFFKIKEYSPRSDESKISMKKQSVYFLWITVLSQLQQDTKVAVPAHRPNPEISGCLWKPGGISISVP